MNKSETIFYKVRNNIYVNLTNRCPCACEFCIRGTRDHMEESDPLWLDHEPAIEEVIAAAEKSNIEEYDEVVFCGFGEPTEAFDVLIKTAKYIKDNYNKKTRINTNGLGNLINRRDILPEMEGLIDTLSISLNAPDAERYNEIVMPDYGLGSFDAMLDFTKEAKQYVSNIIMTTVDTTISKEEEAACASLCEKLGVKYRIRVRED